MKKRRYTSYIMCISGFIPLCYAASSQRTHTAAQREQISAGSLPQFNKADFEANAKLFGNKTANLMELVKIAAYLNSFQKAKTFAVPSFFGLSSADVIAYLQKMPYEQTTVWAYILEQWQQFIASQPQGATLLSAHARIALTNIRAALAATEFDVTAITQNSQLQLFLDAAVEHSNLLMVRSTGREDGKELSNAGGNTSVASVAPTNDIISAAIQEVLSSYFSEKSIGQRLLGKDKNLLDTPFMAVLLQVMTGEVYGESNEIPKSGVMFSPEAEGETPGVVVIQATFGHNEGVVNGLVPVDTYYVGPSNIIHPLISIKPKRLAALPGKEGLGFVENDAKQQRISTLNPETALALKEAAQFTQSYYNNAVDIEFVILGNTIYFVQARPLEDKTFEASYLKSDFISQNTRQTISVAPIGIGNGAVRIIEKPEQVIITNNIRQALDTFLFKTSNQDAIQAVIINESAPATSHEATQFRRLGKPVLYAQELNTIKTWLQQVGTAANFAGPSSSTSVPTASGTNGSPLLIDAQRAIVIQFMPTENFVTPESTIEPGWYAHPIAKKVSLMQEFFPKLQETIMRKLAPEEFFKGMSTTALIDIIKVGDKNSVSKALRSLLHRTWAALQKMQIMQHAQTVTQPQLIPQLKHVFSCMLASAYEIIAAQERDNATRLESLYPILFLEALLRQLPEPNRLVNDYSFGSIFKTELLEQSIVQELKLHANTERARITQYAKADTYALVPEVKENFDTYLQQFAALPNQQLRDRFAKLMFNLAELDILPLWLNTSFEHAYAAHKGNAEEITKSLLEEYDATTDFIAQLQSLQQFFATFNVAAFEDPTAFAKQWQNLQKNISVLSSPYFLHKFDTTTDLGKMAALRTMNAAVATFDASVKALTGSNIYTDENLKISRFKTMLASYFTLLESWANIPHIQRELHTMLDGKIFTTVEKYLNTIKTALSETQNEPKQLQPSILFNVAAATLGSKAAWDDDIGRSYALTLEDLFSLIHQNLLVIQNVLTKKTSLIGIRAPETAQALKDAADYLFVQTSHDKKFANLIGLSFTNNQLIYYYNLPLRNHSNTFQIIYDLKTHKTFLAIQFFGVAAENRWQRFADTIYLISLIQGLHLEKAIEMDEVRGMLTFTWEINSPEQATDVFIPLGILAHRSLDFLQGSYVISDTARSARNISNAPENVIKELIKRIPERPSLINYLPEIQALEHIQPNLRKQALDLLVTHFPAMPPDSQRAVLREFLYLPASPRTYVAVRALFNIIHADLNLFSTLANETDQMIQSVVKESAIIQELVNNTYLSSPSETEQVRGINILSNLYGNTADSFIPFANNTLQKFLKNPSPIIKVAVIDLTKALRQNNNLKDEQAVLHELFTILFNEKYLEAHTKMLRDILFPLRLRQPNNEFPQNVILRSVNFGDSKLQNAALGLSASLFITASLPHQELIFDQLLTIVLQKKIDALTVEGMSGLLTALLSLKEITDPATVELLAQKIDAMNEYKTPSRMIFTQGGNKNIPIILLAMKKISNRLHHQKDMCKNAGMQFNSFYELRFGLAFIIEHLHTQKQLFQAREVAQSLLPLCQGTYAHEINGIISHIDRKLMELGASYEAQSRLPE